MRRPGRSWVLLLLGLAAMGLAIRALVPASRPAVHPITLTAGPFGTTRTLIARTLVHAIEARGGQAQLVAASEARSELAEVEAGTVDFALVSEAYPVGGLSHVREVTPLYMEALHLLVKSELTAQASPSVPALRGRRVDVGSAGSTTAGLATAVLAFAGMTPATAAGDDGYVPDGLALTALEARIAAGDRAALPDAILHLATLPSEIAIHLVSRFDYRLVPLPFAEAFRLNAVLLGDGQTAGASGVERQHVADVVIPAFTYRREPPVPPEPLHTIGTRLTLVAHERVSPETVELVLEAVFSGQVARLAQPPLEPTLLALPPQLPRHEGTLEYLRRDKPLITQDTVDTLGNSFSVLGAVGGALLFLWQWWRQRRQAERDERFGAYLLRMAEVERRMTGLELAATLDLEPLVDLQREVLTLKGDVLEAFAAGELGSRAALADLLIPLNATRDHIGDLLLHVRSNLEEQAQAEGRSATALWTDAIEPPAEPESSG